MSHVNTCAHDSICVSVMDTCVLRLSGNMVFSQLWTLSVTCPKICRHILLVLYRCFRGSKEGPDIVHDHREFTTQSRWQCPTQPGKRAESFGKFLKNCVCVNTYTCVSHLCLVPPHIHENQMGARIWNCNASPGSDE